MERRDELRRARRVAVRFREMGDEKLRSGFTTDISHGGMFVGTNHVLPPGTRLRVEVVDPANGFVVEGVVARALRRNPTMGQRGQPSGMGVRFLQIEELVEGLFPHASSEPREGKGAGVGGGRPDSRNGRREGQGPDSDTPTRGFLVRFRSSDDLERTWARDVAQGGLFVSARDPAAIGEVIILEVRPPEDAPGGQKVRLDARVVHVFDRQGGGAEANLLSGMGVEFLDPDRAREALGTLLGR